MEKNFVARISAIIRNFERNVHKAQRLAKTAIPDEIETDVTANISKFQRGLMRAKAMAQKWRSHDVEFKADTSQLMTKYGATRLSVEKWKEHTVNINANTNRFMRAIKGAKKSLIDLNKHEYRPNLGWVDKETNKLVKSVKYVEGRYTNMFSTIKKGWAQTQKAQNNFDNTMQSMAQSIRSFGTVFSNQIKGTMIATFQGLIPIIAGLVPVIMAVGNALKVVTGGAIGLAGAVAIAAGGFVGFGAMAISAVKMLSDGTLQATNETKKYQSALQGVKDTWASIIKKNQAGIFTTMANGLNAIKVAMKGLTPFLSGVTDGMAKASAKMLDWAKNSNVAKNFFKAMGTTGVSIFNDLLNAGGRFGDGLVNVFTQLMPLFKWSSQWLERLGASFSKWANSAKGQNAIKDFMEYTKQNLPLIGKIFGNTFAGINNLLKAFSGNSTNIFKSLADMTQKFRDWSETVGKSEGFKKFVDYVQQNGPKIMQLIGNIVMLLVNFGIAMAPISSVILDVVNAIAGFTSELFKSHPGVAKLLGLMTILGGILLAVLPTIVQIAIFVKDLLIPFLRWAKNAGLVKNAMKLLKPILEKVLKPTTLLRSAFGMLAGALGAISAPVWIVIGVVAALVGAIVWLWNTNEDFRNAVTQAWETISKTIGEAISGLVSWFKALWTKIQETLKPIMPLLQQVGSVVNQVLGVVFIGAIKALVGVFQFFITQAKIAWTIVGTIISVAVQLVVGILTAFIQFLSGDFSGAWTTLSTTISNVMTTIWNGILSIWTTITNFLLETYSNITGQTVTSWSQMWSIISGKLAAIWTSVSSYFTQVLSTIISIMSSVVSNIVSTWNNIVSTIAGALSRAVSAVVSGMASMLSNIVSAMMNIVSQAVSGMQQFVGAITDGVSRAVSAVRNFIGDFTQAGIDLVMGFVNGIREKIEDAVNAARSMASAAVSAVRGALDSHSPSRVLKSIGNDTVNGFVIGIEKLTPKAISASKHLGMAVVDNFNADLVPSLDTSLMRSNVSSAVGNIDGYIDSDVRHSIAESNKPVVNLVVKNEGDIELIKSTIEDMSAKENNTFSF